MAHSWIRTRNLWLPNRRDAQTFVLFKVLTVVQRTLRVMSNFMKGKKRRLLIGIFFFRKKLPDVR